MKLKKKKEKMGGAVGARGVQICTVRTTSVKFVERKGRRINTEREQDKDLVGP